MKILKVKMQNGICLEIGDQIAIKFYPIVNDEEDKENPVEKSVFIEAFEPNDDGSSIRIIGDDGEDYYYDNFVKLLL